MQFQSAFQRSQEAAQIRQAIAVHGKYMKGFVLETNMEFLPQPVLGLATQHT